MKRLYAFKVVSCHVYVGLTDEEALWLASRHNANGHFQHQMTHRDYVSYLPWKCAVNFTFES